MSQIMGKDCHSLAITNRVMVLSDIITLPSLPCKTQTPTVVIIVATAVAVIIIFSLDLIGIYCKGGSNLMALLSVPVSKFPSEELDWVRPSMKQSCQISSGQIFFGQPKTICFLRHWISGPSSGTKLQVRHGHVIWVEYEAPPDRQAASCLGDLASWLGPWWWHRISSRSQPGQNEVGTQLSFAWSTAHLTHEL